MKGGNFGGQIATASLRPVNIWTVSSSVKTVLKMKRTQKKCFANMFIDSNITK